MTVSQKPPGAVDTGGLMKKLSAPFESGFTMEAALLVQVNPLPMSTMVDFSSWPM